MADRFISCFIVCLFATISIHAALPNRTESSTQSNSIPVYVPAIDPNGFTVDIAVESPYTTTAPHRIGAGDNGSFGEGEDGTKLPEVNNKPVPVGDIPWPFTVLFLFIYYVIRDNRSRKSSNTSDN